MIFQQIFMNMNTSYTCIIYSVYDVYDAPLSVIQMISLIKCYLFAANISSSMVFNGCPRLMVVCAICRMCTQLAMIHFSKEKLFISQKLLHNKLNIQRCCRWAVFFNWTKLFQSRSVGQWPTASPDQYLC